MNNSDCSLMDTSMQDTSALPGSFPSFKQPQQENPPQVLDEDLSFIPYQQQQQQQTSNNNDDENYTAKYILPRSPVFSFKSRKAKYPNFFNDDGTNKENGINDDGVKFNFESDILTKKFSQRLSNKVLQELDSRMNDTGVDKIKRNLFSPRSQIRRQLKDKLLSPRSQVHNGFNVVHNRHFNKMDSINNHYSVHGNGNGERGTTQREEDRKVRKKRRTLVGPEEIMEDIQQTEQVHKEQANTFKTPTLDPRRKPLDTSRRLAERRIKEPRERVIAEPRKILDPKLNTLRRLPSSRDLSRDFPRKTSSRDLSREITRKTSSRDLSSRNIPQSQTPEIKPSSIPVLNKKTSFLKPTASSLSKSTSSYDIHHNKNEIRKSQSTVFNTKQEPIKRSSTASNLKSRMSHSRTMHDLSSASIDPRISSSYSHHNLSRMTGQQESCRPVWR